MTPSDQLLAEMFLAEGLVGSVIIAIGATIAALLLSLLVACALPRTHPAEHGAKVGLFVPLMFAATVVLLPLFLILLRSNILVPGVALIIGYAFAVVPFCVWKLNSIIGFRGTLGRGQDRRLLRRASLSPRCPARHRPKPRRHAHLLTHRRLEPLCGHSFDPAASWIPCSPPAIRRVQFWSGLHRCRASRLFLSRLDWVSCPSRENQFAARHFVATMPFVSGVGG